MAYVYERYTSKKAIIAYCAKRNQSIYSFRQKGWTLKELAAKYHLTLQRVGQIVQEQEQAARKTKRKAS